MLLVACGLFMIGQLAGARAADSSTKPNFLFVLVDDLGWADLGCYGSSFYDTPNLDQLARDGIRFTSAYTAASICSPTRASILTGRHPVRVNITDWIPGMKSPRNGWKTPEDLSALPLEEVTLAEELGRHGYQTFYAGKWHLGKAQDGTGPASQGFEVVKDESFSADWRKNPLTSNRLTGAAIDFLKSRDTERPFLLYLSFHKVHTPIISYPAHIAKYEARAGRLQPTTADPIPEHKGLSLPRQQNPSYASMVRAVDDHVGQLRAALRELGLERNTVFIFFSDNGGLCTKKKPGPTCNLPLRSGKGWLYEGGIRVPLIVRAPGRVKPGTETGVPVVSTDFFPTLLELAGLPPRPDLHRDGVSFVPLLQGASKLGRDTLYWHYPHYHGSTWAPGGAIRQGDWKLIEFFTEGTHELYNLKDDLGEQHDLASRRPEKARELLAALKAWRAEIGAQMPTRR